MRGASPSALARIVVAEDSAPDASSAPAASVDPHGARSHEAAQLPIAFRTKANGLARYTELRHFPFQSAERHVTISAEGFVTRHIWIEFSGGEYLLRVPMVPTARE